MRPFFSVIVPTYNRAKFIRNTIDSVLSQTYTDLEVIVVDDGSTDDTSGVVGSLGDGRVQYHRQENQERAVARNKGTALSTGKYVTFLDSDDLLNTDHLAAAAEMVEKYESPEFIHLGYEIFDPVSNTSRKIDHLPEIANDRLIDGNYLSCRGVFLRRDIAEKYPFNADRALSGSEDYELWLRIASRYTLYCDNRITSRLIQHDGRSMNDTDSDKLKTRIGLLEKYVLADEEFSRRFGRAVQRFRANNSVYIALHLALSRMDRMGSVSYLFGALRYSPGALRNPAFYGTIKRLLV